MNQEFKAEFYQYLSKPINIASKPSEGNETHITKVSFEDMGITSNKPSGTHYIEYNHRYQFDVPYLVSASIYNEEGQFIDGYDAIIGTSHGKISIDLYYGGEAQTSVSLTLYSDNGIVKASSLINDSLSMLVSNALKGKPYENDTINHLGFNKEGKELADFIALFEGWVENHNPIPSSAIFELEDEKGFIIDRVTYHS
jgi:hypothetical protein